MHNLEMQTLTASAFGFLASARVAGAAPRISTTTSHNFFLGFAQLRGVVVHRGCDRCCPATAPHSPPCSPAKGHLWGLRPAIKSFVVVVARLTRGWHTQWAVTGPRVSRVTAVSLGRPRGRSQNRGRPKAGVLCGRNEKHRAKTSTRYYTSNRKLTCPTAS
jgi:hypothetical protein